MAVNGQTEDGKGEGELSSSSNPQVSSGRGLRHAPVRLVLEHVS